MLHQLPLGTDRVECLQQRGPQKAFGATDSRPVVSYSLENSPSRLARNLVPISRIVRSGCFVGMRCSMST